VLSNNINVQRRVVIFSEDISRTHICLISYGILSLRTFGVF